MLARPRLGTGSTFACFLVIGGVAAALLVAAYRAAERAEPSRYLLFWTAMVVVTLPAAGALTSRRIGDRARTWLLVAYAAFTFLPKLLRNPFAPLYHDEFAHWRETVDLLDSGRLFQPNPIIGVISRFPGMHAATASISAIGGVGVWTAAQMLLVVAHVLTLLGVAAFTARLFGDARAAALAAVLYGLNSSFLYFDTQFGYESVAIVMLVWTLVAFTHALLAERSSARRGWAALALALAAATVITHHLTAIWLVAIMAGVATGLSLPRLRRPAPVAVMGVAWAVTVGTAVALLGWIAVVAPQTTDYLWPFLGRALDQLSTMVGGGGGGRKLFNRSTVPWWEHAAAFAAPVVALAAAGAAVADWRRRLRVGLAPAGPAGALLVAMAVLAVIYFPSVGFIFAPSGAEGARRSWAFSYLGLAVLVAPIAIGWLDRLRASPRRAAVAGQTFLAGALVVTMVGNTAAGLNEAYRFPGPYQFGSDTRSTTPELLAAAHWLRQTRGQRLRVVTDRYTGLAFASYGRADTAAPSNGFRTWDLYLTSPDQPTPRLLLHQLATSDYTYLIVDRRIATDLPVVGVYFEPDEPFEHLDRSPFTSASVTKFDALPWTIKVYDSDHYAIYRFDFTSVDATVRGTGKAIG